MTPEGIEPYTVLFGGGKDSIAITPTKKICYIKKIGDYEKFII